MRAFATLAAALLVGAGMAAAQEQPTAGDPAPAAPAPSKGNWFTRLLPFGHKTEEKKPPPPPEAPKQTVVESAASVNAREKAAWRRRLEVVLKLQTIADDTNDDQLRRKAAELDRLAFDTYWLRTARLRAGGAAFNSDENTLAQRLGPRGEDGRSLPATAASASAAGGVAARRE